MVPAASLTILVSFNASDGADPIDDLIIAAAGDLSGAAFDDGTNRPRFARDVTRFERWA